MIHLIGAVDDMAAAVRARDGLVALAVDDTVYVGVPLRNEPVPDMASLCAHDAAVIELMGACTVVPFRFGTVVSGAADLADKLNGRGAEMPYLLKRLRGRREVALRAGVDRGRSRADGKPSTGAGYLSRLRESAAVPEELTSLHERLASQAVDAMAQWDPVAGLFRASYLVGLADVASFSGAASRLAAKRPAISSISLTGPWAPYTFTRISAAPSRSLREDVSA